MNWKRASLFFLTFFLFTTGLRVAVAYSQREETVRRARDIVEMQLGYQALAIGTYGTSALFTRLVETGTDLLVSDLKVWKNERLIMSRAGTQSNINSGSFIFFGRFNVRIGELTLQATILPTSEAVANFIALSIGISLVLALGLIWTLASFRTTARLSLESENLELAKQVAHDIRSPLSALKIVASCSQELPDEQRQMIEMSVARIDGIANTLLDRTRVDRKRTLHSSLLTLQRQFKLIHPSLSFDIAIGDDVGQVAVDDDKELINVVSNLLQNAVDANSLTGSLQIALEAEVKDKQLVFSVTDMGPGIPNHKAAKIFKRGYSTKGLKGNGLGLSSAEQFARKLGGKVSFKNNSVEGCMFTLEIPVERLNSKPDVDFRSLISRFIG